MFGLLKKVVAYMRFDELQGFHLVFPPRLCPWVMAVSAALDDCCFSFIKARL